MRPLGLGIAATIPLALCTSAAVAQKHEFVRGAGGSSCATYVQVYDAYKPFIGNEAGLVATQAYENYGQFESWLQGYLFGLDSWNKGQIRQYDRASMQIWIYDYCQRKPLDIVANAGLAFYREVGGPIPTGGDQSARSKSPRLKSKTAP